MTNLYDLNWPVNYQSQAELTRRLARRVSELEARKKNIIIRSAFQPTKAQWENAWVEQTSLPLPIPPGTRLCWYNLTRGYVETFTTAFDAQNGVNSSGNIYSFLDSTFDRPPLRLLGVFDSNEGHSDNIVGNMAAAVRVVHMPWNQAKPTVPYNPYTLADYGLLNIICMYRLKINSTNNALRFFLNIGSGFTFSWWPADAAKEADMVNLEVLQPASTPTSSQTTGVGTPIASRWMGGRPANNNSPAGAYSHGFLVANGVPLDTFGGDIAREYSGFSGWHMTTRYDGLATGQFGFNMGSWMKNDAWGPSVGQNWVSIVAESPGSSDRVLGKMWLYGLFTKNTQELKEDSRL